MFRGGYPHLYDVPMPTGIYFRDYTATYISRDVAEYLGNVTDFNVFLRLCAENATHPTPPSATCACRQWPDVAFYTESVPLHMEAGGNGQGMEKPMTDPNQSTHSERICMRAIGDLIANSKTKPYRFFVPAYQRGYRWGYNEINALMDDLSVYFDDVCTEYYCLQPIVVRPHMDDGNEDGPVYEVIDGQQRLTTLFILLKYAKPSYGSARDKTRLYDISYETRPGSRDFLRSLDIDTAHGEEAEANPDFHYIAQAWRTINDWVDQHDKGPEEDLFVFLNHIKKYVQVIWYEALPTDDPIDLFRKINVGKIPLTNAELVKGLLIANAEASNSPNEEVTAVASEWDRIEHRLQDEELWYFLTNDSQNIYPTRMDLILDIWLRTEDLTATRDDTHNPYQVFQKLYGTSDDQRPDALRRMWGRCKEIFANLESWYEQREMYHLIGYLVAHRPSKSEKKLGTDIRDLYAELSTLDKSEMNDVIRRKIQATLNGDGYRCGDDPDGITELSYQDGRVTRNVLLLFNLLTINTANSAMRFPFNLYKNQNWDLEHIHSTAGGPPKDSEITTQKENLDSASIGNVRKSFFEGLRNQLRDIETQSGSIAAESPQTVGVVDKPASQLVDDFIAQGTFDEQSCMDFWNDNVGRLTIEGQDNIDNMALLTDDINRGYGNANFIEKRRWIIEADRTTTFVPPCTKNVFLKYYSSDPKDFLIWGTQDRAEYLHGEYGIIETIKRYLQPERHDDHEEDQQ